MNAKSSLLLFGLAAVLIGALVYALLPGAAPVRPDDQTLVGPDVERVVAPRTARSTEVTLNLREGEGRGAGGPTSVLWPLVVDLELEVPADLPSLAGVDAGGTLGAGANARLSGRIGLGVDGGAKATITFIAGANTGRVLHTDAEGKFGATDLLPGLGVVEIDGPRLVGAQREVRLRQRHEVLLNIGFGRLGNVQGHVFAGEDEPVEGALVTVDGHTGRTDLDGYFYIGGIASGHSHIVIEKPGFASLREPIAITAAATTPPGRLKYRLEKGAELTILIDGHVGGPGPAEVWLSPGVPNRQSTYPFWKLNPLRVQPGQLYRIPDLPNDLIRVQVFRTGALAVPETRNVNLRSARDATHTVRLEAAPKISGVVLRDGAPVHGAKVTLEAPDQVQAALRHYRQPVQFLESAILPMPPNAHQTTHTNDRGRFVISQWTDATPVRYLAAESRDGSAFALRMIDKQDVDVSLDLEPRDVDRGVVELVTKARFQGLPVEWRVNGEPREDFVAPPLDGLEFGGLREGQWRVRVSWYSRELLDESGVEVTADGVELRVDLPDDAIIGQEREDWIRAGREYPF